MTLEIPTSVDARIHLPMPRDCTGCERAQRCIKNGNAAAKALLEKIALEPLRGGVNIGKGVDYARAENAGAVEEYFAVVDSLIDLDTIESNCPGATEEYGNTIKVTCGLE